jgi:hypothetical protein
VVNVLYQEETKVPKAQALAGTLTIFF